jgi:hypothetical protein
MEPSPEENVLQREHPNCRDPARRERPGIRGHGAHYAPTRRPGESPRACPSELEARLRATAGRLNRKSVGSVGRWQIHKPHDDIAPNWVIWARSAFSLTFPVTQRDAAGRRCPRSPSLWCSASDLLEVTVSRRPGWLSIWHRGRQASAMPRYSEGGGKGRTSRRGVTERVRAPRNGDPHDAEPFPSVAGSAARPGAAASAAGW